MKIIFFRLHVFVDKYNGNGFFSDLTDIVFTFFYSWKACGYEITYFFRRYFKLC